MTLLEKLKSILGFGDEDSADDDRDVGVTVERNGRGARADTATGTAEDEAAGSGASTDQSAGASPDVDADESSTDADAEESSPDVDAEESSTDTGAEESSKDTDAEESSIDTDADESPAEATTEETATDESDQAAEESESRVPSEAVDVIKGIGPTYADRLSNAGIETVEDLASADVDDVAGSADVPRGRLEDWVQRAKARAR